MGPESSNVVHEDHSDADYVSVNPQRIQPGLGDQWPMEKQP